MDSSKTAADIGNASYVEAIVLYILEKVVQSIDALHVVRSMVSDSLTLVHRIIDLAVSVSTLMRRCVPLLWIMTMLRVMYRGVRLNSMLWMITIVIFGLIVW